MKKLFAILCLLVLLFSIVRADHVGRSRRRHRIRTVMTSSPIRPPNPANISGLVVRVFDAANNSFTDAAKTTKPNDGNSIRVWRDTNLNQDLTVPAGAFQPVFRSADNALDFDGVNDFLTSGNTTLADFDRLQPFSVFAVVEIDAIPGVQMITSKNRGIIGIGRGWQLLFAGNAGLFFEFVNTSSSNQIRNIDTTTTFLTATLYSIVLTYDGSGSGANTTMRINKVEVTVSNPINNLSGTTLNTGEFNVGNRNNNDIAGESMDGKIREVAVWNKELSLAEKIILDDYVTEEYPTIM